MNEREFKTFALLSAVIVMFLLCALFSACTTAPNREFNAEDKQDQACYAKYGGLRGFCDATVDNE